MAVLPRSAPAPRMLWSLDRDGWVVPAFEDVDGVHPTLPWRPDELARVLALVADLAAALTPAPPGLPPCGPSSSARAWSPWSGCGIAPAGAEAEARVEGPGLDEGPAQLLQPGCRPLSAWRKLVEPSEPPGPHEPLTFRRPSGLS